MSGSRYSYIFCCDLPVALLFADVIFRMAHCSRDNTRIDNADCGESMYGWRA